MLIIRWIFEKILFFEFYWFEKNSRDIDVEKMYSLIIIVSVVNSAAFFVVLIRLYVHFFNNNGANIAIPTLVFLYVTVAIEEIILRKKKYVQTLIEVYKAMAPEEKKRLAKEGLYYRTLPVLSIY